MNNKERKECALWRANEAKRHKKLAAIDKLVKRDANPSKWEELKWNKRSQHIRKLEKAKESRKAYFARKRLVRVLGKPKRKGKAK